MSPNGKLVYFTSSRDGFRCIWAVRLGASYKPDGDPFPVYHFHKASLSPRRTALNALIQGSAAVHTKRWIRAVWREMRYAPMLQMHDCLDCSVDSKEQAEQIARLGEEAVNLTVPMMIDRQTGRLAPTPSTLSKSCMTCQRSRGQDQAASRPGRRRTTSTVRIWQHKSHHQSSRSPHPSLSPNRSQSRIHRKRNCLHLPASRS